MLHRILWPLIYFSVLTAVTLAVPPARAADAVKEVRLYALDCGHIEFKDFGPFADTDEYDGKPGAIAVPCFVIRQAKGTLLWDTGLGEQGQVFPFALESSCLSLHRSSP